MIVSLLTALALSSSPNNLIVQLVPTADPVAVAKLDGVTYVDRTANAPFALFSSTDSKNAQIRLLADKNVMWVEDEEELHTLGDTMKGGSLSVVGGTNTAVATADKNLLTQINWNSTIANSTTGRSVRLAIIDTGMSRSQTDLWASVDASLDVFGGTADEIPMKLDTNGDKIVDGALGHGTMVAGIAHLVAPKVRLVICKVADSDGSATTWNTIKGIAFAAVNGAEVANISLASPSQVAAFQDVAEWANGKGMAFVAAIGNDAIPKAYYPAGSAKSLCVAGLNSDDSKASFSNWNSDVSSSAPAVNISSNYLGGKMATGSGTSFASPFVAAAIADCLRRTTVQRPQDVIKAAKDSGTKIDNVNKKFSGNLGSLLNFIALNTSFKPRS